jgi:hypothetical protein
MKLNNDISEATLQAHCNKYLNLLGVMFYHQTNSTGKNRYSKSGIPDLVVWFPKGKTIFFELKDSKGRVKPEQIKFKDDILKLGFEHYVIRPETFEAFCTIVQKNLDL